MNVFRYREIRTHPRDPGEEHKLSGMKDAVRDRRTRPVRDDGI
jgi:hypothetical protein